MTGQRARGPELAQCINHPTQDAPDIFSQGTGMTSRAHRTQAPEPRADHRIYIHTHIPGAETPPGSHLPRGRGQGHGGFWLHPLCVPAALPASVLKRSRCEKAKREKGLWQPVQNNICPSSPWAAGTSSTFCIILPSTTLQTSRLHGPC